MGKLQGQLKEKARKECDQGSLHEKETIKERWTGMSEGNRKRRKNHKILRFINYF